MKNFEEFRRSMETDEEFVAKAFALLEGVTDEQEKVDLLVKFAVENGYDASVEDFTREQAGNHEVSEEELELVAGGKGGQWCWADYDCLATWHHCYISDECEHSMNCKENTR